MNVNPDYLSVCEKAVRAAGAVLLERLGRVTVREKGQADLVTEADIASQEVVRRTVLGAFPDHALLSEEDQPGSTRAAGASECRWILDPLDGTTNYVHQVPHFSVSLALERSGRLLVGAIYDPVAEECFTATHGKGARLNGAPISTSNVSSVPDALVAIGLPTVVVPDAPDLRTFLEAVQVCQSIRRTGSAALNLAYVAAGRFDACWSFTTKAWDAAAGALLIREAGGLITSPDGSPFVLDRGQFLAAANAALHRQLREVMARAGL